MNKKRITKNFCKIENCDFNTISSILRDLHCKSFHSSSWLKDHCLNCTFQIKNVQSHLMFKDLFIKLKSFLKVPKNHKSNLDIFFSLAPGAASDTHKDNYDVAILAVKNDIVVRVNEERHILNPGDLIKINKDEIHQIIGIDPRIIISFGHSKDMNL